MPHCSNHQKGYWEHGFCLFIPLRELKIYPESRVSSTISQSTAFNGCKTQPVMAERKKVDLGVAKTSVTAKSAVTKQRRRVLFKGKCHSSCFSGGKPSISRWRKKKSVENFSARINKFPFSWLRVLSSRRGQPSFNRIPGPRIMLNRVAFR